MSPLSSGGDAKNISPPRDCSIIPRTWQASVTQTKLLLTGFEQIYPQEGLLRYRTLPELGDIIVTSPSVDCSYRCLYFFFFFCLLIRAKVFRCAGPGGADLRAQRLRLPPGSGGQIGPETERRRTTPLSPQSETHAIGGKPHRCKRKNRACDKTPKMTCD